ncbi:MAG: UDP-N-acetyl-2-amino-2-deoxyglucuronate dehydrogenase [Saprospiraceae bacterium]
MRTYRSMTIDGEEIEFSGGFTELHTDSYKDILSGGGFRIEESRKAIQTVYDIRHAEVIGLKGDYHPLCKLEQVKHPFKR